MVALRAAIALPPLAALVFLPFVQVPAPPPPELPPVLPWLARPGAAALLWLYHALDPAPAAHASAVLLLHASASLLLAWLMHRLFPPRAALLAGLLYALHPMQAETLAASATAASLPGIVLLLTGIHLHLEGRARAALALAAAALLFEPAAAAAPIVFLLVARGTPLTRQVAWLGVAGTALWLAAFAASHGQSASGWPWLGVFTLRSLFLFFFPLGLTPVPELRAPAWQASLAALAVAAAIGFAMSASRRTAAGSWMLAAIVLLVSVYFLPAGDQQPSMALPLLALAPSAALVLAQTDARLAVVYLAALALLAVSHARQWSDPAALWMEAVRLAPNRLEPRLALAPLLPSAQAIELLIETQQKWPDNADVAAAAGQALLRASRPNDAMAEFDRALAMDPRHPAASTGRAAAWIALGREDAAREELRRTLAAEPCYLPARLAAARLGEPPPPVPCRFTRAQRRALTAATSRR
ncbi:MAG: tetratricopeptide repeat protein [Bryobacteraceae bacterium]|nr:tetratricopeptide repeat protein [Bryobacteraceae bacterium]